MHIAEGIITGVPAIASAAVGVGLLGIGAAKMKKFVSIHPQRKPLLGMAAAFIFFLSLIPIPAFNGTCSHPCGSPLAGILLGPWIGIALSALSLLLQALFFNHGGFTSWGANVLALGVGGAFGGWFVYSISRRCGASFWVAGALGGLFGDIFTYLISGLILGATLSQAPYPQFTFSGYLTGIYLAYLPVQSWIAIGEMLLTGYTVHYIQQQRPEMLPALRRKTAKVLVLLLFGGVLFLAYPVHATSFPATPLRVAQTQPDRFTGMDESVNNRLATDAGKPASKPLINVEKMGDLWNTLLLLAGGICGFVIGRWWHLLFGKAPSSIEETKEQ